MMTRLPLTIALTLLTNAAQAQDRSFALTLGDRQIGTLAFAGSGANASLLSTLDNTPLGVADGTFQAAATASGDTVGYQGANRGSKTRDIAYARTGGTVTTVTVMPADDMTDLSVATAVPAGTLTPPEVFGQLANGTTCPNPMALYDGRRVAQIATTAMADAGGTVTCDISYRVVLGKGHLSPFNFKSLAMQAEYRGGAFARLTVSAGGFDVNILAQ